MNFSATSAELIQHLVETVIDAAESTVVSDSFRQEALANLELFVIAYNLKMLEDMTANLDKLGDIVLP